MSCLFLFLMWLAFCHMSNVIHPTVLLITIMLYVAFSAPTIRHCIAHQPWFCNLHCFDFPPAITCTASRSCLSAVVEPYFHDHISFPYHMCITSCILLLVLLYGSGCGLPLCMLPLTPRHTLSLDWSIAFAYGPCITMYLSMSAPSLIVVHRVILTWRNVGDEA